MIDIQQNQSSHFLKCLIWNWTHIQHESKSEYHFHLSSWRCQRLIEQSYRRSKACICIYGNVAQKQVVGRTAPFPIRVSLSATKEASADHEAALKDAHNRDAEDGSAGIRQLLGIKGASELTGVWNIRLQLTKVRSSTRCTSGFVAVSILTH